MLHKTQIATTFCAVIQFCGDDEISVIFIYILLKQNWLQFLFVVKTTTMKQQESKIMSAETHKSYHIYSIHWQAYKKLSGHLHLVTVELPSLRPASVSFSYTIHLVKCCCLFLLPTWMHQLVSKLGMVSFVSFKTITILTNYCFTILLLTLKVSSTTLMPSVFSFMLASDFFFLFSREFLRDFWT